MEWLKKLSAAIDYIENNLDSDISYDEAAKIACCSTFYFQRIFSYVAGVSLSEYIRRRRMTQAAFELQRTGAKVIDIALKYGYSSPTSFNRAFQSVHNITPAAARLIGNTVNAYPANRFSVQVTGGNAITYHIMQKQSIRMVGVRIPLVEEMEENYKIIPKFWKSVLNSNLFSEVCNLSNQSPKGVLGVSVYENPQRIFYYIAVATNEPAPSGMFEFEIPSATWAVFENKGYFKENVQNIFRRFYTEWLPFSGYEYAGLPDVEVYPICKGTPVSGHSEVWISIKKDKEDGTCII